MQQPYLDPHPQMSRPEHPRQDQNSIIAYKCRTGFQGSVSGFNANIPTLRGTRTSACPEKRCEFSLVVRFAAPSKKDENQLAADSEPRRPVKHSPPCPVSLSVALLTCLSCSDSCVSSLAFSGPSVLPHTISARLPEPRGTPSSTLLWVSDIVILPPLPSGSLIFLLLSHSIALHCSAFSLLCK